MDSRTHLADDTKIETHHVTAPSVDLMTETGIGTQAIFGQRFDVIETRDGLSRGALYSIIPGCERIDYIGIIPSSALSDKTFKPMCIVTAVTAAVFEAADIKSRLVGSLPRNSVLMGEVVDGFLKLPQGGFIHERHIRDLKTPLTRPFFDVAKDMLNLPYIWGGTGQIGVDCSGLVQSALAATDVDAPRDADQQELKLGQSVNFTDRHAGDLLFWPGHVGIVLDGDRLLHANAHHMCVAIEPVTEAVDRIGEVRTTKRM